MTRRRGSDTPADCSGSLRRGIGGLTVALPALQAGPSVILLLLVVVLSLLSDVFLSLENVGNVLKQSAVICVLALGQLLVIVTRGIDLSVGSNLSLSAVVGAIVWRDHGSATLAVLAALGDGLARRPDQRPALRQGPPAAPVHPDPGDAHRGQRPGALPLAQPDHPGRPPVVNEIGSGRIACDPRRRRHRLVPDGDPRRPRGRRCS